MKSYEEIEKEFISSSLSELNREGLLAIQEIIKEDRYRVSTEEKELQKKNLPMKYIMK